MELCRLSNVRIPGYPAAALSLDGNPLCIVAVDTFTEQTESSKLTAALGVATVLYRWCPDALYAFLDFEAWFSFTWLLTLQQGLPDESKIEIGRVKNQVTVGSLDKDGANWKLMITYDISLSRSDRGSWLANPGESMLDGKDIKDPTEIDSFGQAFVRNLLINQRWSTGPKIQHQMFVEYAPMDIWGDGIAMSPHWLYKTLNLSKCTVCDKVSVPANPLRRCGRCGTAAYCSGECQRLDWAVHKSICNMNTEDRGQALHLTQHGGLINWDRSKTVNFDDDERDEDNEQGWSRNPNFCEPQRKRDCHTYAENATIL